MAPPSFDAQRSGSFLSNVPLVTANTNNNNTTAASSANNQCNATVLRPAKHTNGKVAGFSDAWLTAQNFNDMNSYNPNYMVAPHVTHEFNLLNDFLSNGILDDNGNMTPEQSMPAPNDMMAGFNPPPAAQTSMPPPKRSAKAAADKTREYYLQAADPSGNDNAEERMARVLHAKYDAGLLKPFNYINGYARLGKYLDGHIAPSSKQKILRTINQFRPKFREKAQGLTDMQLIIVEMWFEKQLMDYDRVFASMAVPACCWRRTGEIFRGNKEMAELINVPVDKLRDVCNPRWSCLFFEGLLTLLGQDCAA